MKNITGILSALLIFFAPIKGILLSVCIVICLDTIMGLYKSFKLGTPITSKRMSAIVSKLLLYQCTVLSVYIFDLFLVGEFFKIWFQIEFLFTKLVGLTLFVIEFKSIVENFEAAFNVSVFDILKQLLSRSKEIKEDIEDLTQK